MTRWAAAALALVTAFCIAVVAGIAAAVVVAGGVPRSAPIGSVASAVDAVGVRCPSGRVPDRVVVHHPGTAAGYVICTVGRAGGGVVGVGDAAFVWGMAAARVDPDGSVAIELAGDPAVPLVFSASGLLDPSATAAAIGRARLAVSVAGGRYTTPATVIVWAVS